MVWRKRGGGRAEQALASAAVARITREEGSRALAEIAVRGALARAEVTNPIETLAIVAFDDVPFAQELRASLGNDRDVTLVRVDDISVDAVDGAFAVVPSSLPAANVVAALDPLQPILLGVVLVDDAVRVRRVKARSDDSKVDDPSEELARRLTELTHREAALRKIVDALEKQRTRLEARERALDERESGVEAPGQQPAQGDESARARERAHDERAAALVEREQALEEREREVEDRAREQADRAREQEDRERAAEEAAAANPPVPAIDPARLAEAIESAKAAERRAQQLEEELGELKKSIERAAREQPPAPAGEHEPATLPGDYDVQHLEELVRDAQLRGEAQVEEWAYYLPLLREHADADGRLPAEFNALVDSVFGLA